MKTETHFKLALSLSLKYLADRPLFGRAFFVAGCVEPDIDPFSYLKGFTVRPFFGHNWENAKKYILNCAEKAECGRAGYFEMGKFVHYLCDAFTFPHNAGFKGGLYEHVLYEKRLHARVFEHFGSGDISGLEKSHANLHEWVEQLHESYVQDACSENTDARFICVAADRAVRLWAEQTAGISTEITHQP